MDFIYYTNTYKGTKVTEQEFLKYLISSKGYIDYLTFNKTRIPNDEEWIQNQVDWVTCEVIDMLKDYDAMASAIELSQLEVMQSGIKSESIKSHSITYKESKGDEKIELLRTNENAIFSKIRRALLPTGLLQRTL